MANSRAGSIPATRTKLVSYSVIGNTTDFDSVILGSSPSSSAINFYNTLPTNK